MLVARDPCFLLSCTEDCNELEFDLEHYVIVSPLVACDLYFVRC